MGECSIRSPHRKLARGVIIIRTSDLGRIMDRLKGSTDQMHVRSIVPEREDLDDLMQEKRQKKQEYTGYGKLGKKCL